MRLLLECWKLFERLAKYINQSRVSAHDTFSERLMYEQLEAKNLFAADIVGVLDMAEPASAAFDEVVPLEGELVSENREQADQTASACDGYGSNLAPEISNFSWRLDANNIVVFSGTVSDDVPPSGLVVRFGGLLSGESAIVHPDGTFTFSITLDPPVSGWISAVTTDECGEDSNTAYTYVMLH